MCPIIGVDNGVDSFLLYNADLVDVGLRCNACYICTVKQLRLKKRHLYVFSAVGGRNDFALLIWKSALDSLLQS